MCAHVNHTVDTLEVAFHFEQWGCVQEHAVTFEKCWSKHYVGKPSFILQGQETKPLSCAWALTYDHVACHFHLLPMGTLGQSTGR